MAYLAIAAAIAAIAVVVLAIGSGGDDETDVAAKTTAAQTATATTGAQETATPTATATPDLPLLEPGSKKDLSYKSGDTVRFQVRSPKADEVHVHGYDIERELEPDKTVTISFKATIEGIFDIELHSTEEQIGSLKVAP